MRPAPVPPPLIYDHLLCRTPRQVSKSIWHASHWPAIRWSSCRCRSARSRLPFKEKMVVAVGVRHIHDAKFCCKVFWSVGNRAITKKADNLQINSVAYLKGHRVLAWQQAYLELGTESERMCSPGRANYKVFSPQKAQVKAFWQGEGTKFFRLRLDSELGSRRPNYAAPSTKA